MLGIISQCYYYGLAVAMNVAIWGLIIIVLRKVLFFVMRDESASNIAATFFSVCPTGVVMYYMPSFGMNLVVFVYSVLCITVGGLMLVEFA